MAYVEFNESEAADAALKMNGEHSERRRGREGVGQSEAAQAVNELQVETTMVGR